MRSAVPGRPAATCSGPSSSDICTIERDEPSSGRTLVRLTRVPATIAPMKDLLEGRRFGFALRPQLGQVALGLAIALTVLDLMAWFGWGARDTNGFVIAASWLAVATAVVAALATITALVESSDAADEDRALARLDVLAAFVTVLLYAVSSGLRITDLAAAAASPGATVAALAGLIVLLIDGVVASTLYSSREWAVLDEEEYQPRRHPKRRRAS